MIREPSIYRPLAHRIYCAPLAVHLSPLPSPSSWSGSPTSTPNQGMCLIRVSPQSDEGVPTTVGARVVRPVDASRPSPLTSSVPSYTVTTAAPAPTPTSAAPAPIQIVKVAPAPSHHAAANGGVSPRHSATRVFSERGSASVIQERPTGSGGSGGEQRMSRRVSGAGGDYPARRSGGSVVYAASPTSPRRSSGSVAQGGGRGDRERVVVFDEKGRRREYYR
ncbi:MAG: hypothetical protein M1832_000379 [Thelocarpon impressellum]|nr:MAG: hypothetical protein M1832_000379 [Thelocarpon impressellum]